VCIASTHHQAERDEENDTSKAVMNWRMINSHTLHIFPLYTQKIQVLLHNIRKHNKLYFDPIDVSKESDLNQAKGDKALIALPLRGKACYTPLNISW